MRRDAAFWVACRLMPAGHRHCVHGHLADCPDPDDCPLVGDAGPVAHVVLAGLMCWVFTSEKLAGAHVRVLTTGDAEVEYRRGLPFAQVDAFLASLPGGVRVEDMRCV